jgi:hypothetical protein
MLLFKYQKCGADGYPEENHEQKKPLVNQCQDEIMPSMKEGDRFIV